MIDLTPVHRMTPAWLISTSRDGDTGDRIQQVHYSYHLQHLMIKCILAGQRIGKPSISREIHHQLPHVALLHFHPFLSQHRRLMCSAGRMTSEDVHGNDYDDDDHVSHTVVIGQSGRLW